jgi:copper chaperone
MHDITVHESRAMVKSMSEVQLQVSGMTCGHCEKAVVKAVLKVQGVVEARADRTTGQVVVSTDGASPDVPALIASIVDEGYGVNGAAVVTA